MTEQERDKLLEKYKKMGFSEEELFDEHMYTPVETEDKYKLYFKKRNLEKLDDDGFPKVIQTDYFNESILKEPVNLEGLFEVSYLFANYYRKVTFVVPIDKNDDKHIWKPGDSFVPTTPKEETDRSLSPFYGPRCFIENRHYMVNHQFVDEEPHIITSLHSYMPNDERFIFTDFDEWCIANTGYPMQKKFPLEMIAKSGVKDGDFYNSLQTAREARKIYEEFFPGWSLL